jgi:tetrahydromethanopterin S-methyltransferase subunit G
MELRGQFETTDIASAVGNKWLLYGAVISALIVIVFVAISSLFHPPPRDHP